MKILLLLSILVFVQADIPYIATINFAPGSAAPEGNAMILDAIRVLGLNSEKRIVMNSWSSLNGGNGKVLSSGQQIDIKSKFKQNALNSVKDWKVILYIRKTGMDEDNQIFYGYQESVLHLSKMQPTSSDTKYPFYKSPFVIDQIKLTVNGNTKMTYKIADTINPATWIANHGIYVADVASKTMQNLYYDPYDMAYFY